MRTRTISTWVRGCTFVFLAGLAAGLPVATTLPAQERGSSQTRAETGRRSGATRPGRVRGDSRGTGALNTMKGLSNQGRAARTPDAGSAPAAGLEGAALEAAEASGGDEEKGFVARLVGAIRQYATWILVVLGAALAVAIGWFFMSGRKSEAPEAFLEPLDDEIDRSAGTDSRFSSTKISARDVEDRLGGAVSGTQVETDREYALVVDEEALKMPPLPDEVDVHTGKEYAEDSAIRGWLKKNDYAKAFDEYWSRIEEDGSLEFHGDLEVQLSEYFIRTRDFEKAARILEHHVATHNSGDIDPETYFNLAYVHVQTKTLNKSRRFFRLFVKKSDKPQHVARAKKILRSLEALN